MPSYQHYLTHRRTAAHLTLDLSRINFEQGYFDQMRPAMDEAFQAMTDLEAGEIANPDEGRMVGHYWLRAPDLAFSADIGSVINKTNQRIAEFTGRIHDEANFTDLLVIGIGGSALGPQLIADALGSTDDKLAVHFLDNTDPDGFDRTFARLGKRLATTLVIVISKSGGTKETRNGMLETQAAFKRAGLNFADNAVAVTGEGSALDEVATSAGWLEKFPMWDWVGGRTSIWSAVGLLPAALQGLDIHALLAGAAAMDENTRLPDLDKNLAARLALVWHHETRGAGEKDMVILPYKDRLLLTSRYLQQLIMESLGKGTDLDGNAVQQGIAVYGNKGSTDQHAFVQQLREGVNNFFVNFIVVLKDRQTQSMEVEPGATSGDFLNGFWQGTRDALYENHRTSVTITLDQLDAYRLGALLALYERTVGLYASLININAYHQPGVEAGKKAAGEVLALQAKILDHLKTNPNDDPETIAAALGEDARAETVHHILEHLRANGRA